MYTDPNPLENKVDHSYDLIIVLVKDPSQLTDKLNHFFKISCCCQYKHLTRNTQLQILLKLIYYLIPKLPCYPSSSLVSLHSLIFVSNLQYNHFVKFGYWCKSGSWGLRGLFGPFLMFRDDCFLSLLTWPSWTLCLIRCNSNDIICIPIKDSL